MRIKDKNGVEIQHKDIVKISNAPHFCNGEKIYAFKEQFDEEENRLIQVLYDPNCCRICRQTESIWGCYGEPDEIGIDSENIKIIGNLDTTPELLPLIELNLE